jgi:phosphate starvation-inducible protein PhoH
MERLVGKDPNIGIVELSEADIKRHPLVQTIVKALR